VDWFLPKAAQFLRVLKPTGTFVLNIKERVVDGERHTYVIELILRMREQGWLWTEEFMWHKKNSYPGKWPNQFKNNQKQSKRAANVQPVLGICYGKTRTSYLRGYLKVVARTSGT
jgi:DNA modification methylase